MNKLLAALAAAGVASAYATPTLNQRVIAATQTAHQHPDCAAIAPFYWEIGGAQSRLAGDSVAALNDPTVVDANTLMNIASASKWMFASYVVQRQGRLTQAGIDLLSFTSGYTNFKICLPGQTVGSCLDMGDNGLRSDDTIGHFFYNGGHMQKHADLLGLGALDNATLAAEMQSQLGADVHLSYSQPQLAGGVVTTASDYARFLRKILTGSLAMKQYLSSPKVCTHYDPVNCPTAMKSPTDQAWHYGLGHWIEDDYAHGDDGAFSSAGAFGFYPWIDAGTTWYGVVARRTEDAGEGFESQQCGKQIRRAWVTGVVQP
jgi:CubicO group peptidase (beta-lactamase class C family)